MISQSNLCSSIQSLVDRTYGYFKKAICESSSIVVAAKAPCARCLATARTTPSRSRPVAASTFGRLELLHPIFLNSIKTFCTWLKELISFNNALQNGSFRIYYYFSRISRLCAWKIRPCPGLNKVVFSGTMPRCMQNTRQFKITHYDWLHCSDLF